MRRINKEQIIKDINGLGRVAELGEYVVLMDIGSGELLVRKGEKVKIDTVVYMEDFRTSYIVYDKNDNCILELDYDEVTSSLFELSKTYVRGLKINNLLGN